MGGGGGVFAAMFLTSSWRAPRLAASCSVNCLQPSMLVTKAEAVVVEPFGARCETLTTRWTSARWGARCVPFGAGMHLLNYVFQN